MKSFFLVIGVGVISIVSKAQDLSIMGVLRDQQSRSPIQGATILLQGRLDSTTKLNRISDSAGKFRFTGLRAGSFNITISSVGFGSVTQTIALDTTSLDLTLDLSRKSDVLAGVTITATISMATQKGDTLELNASHFKVNPDATVEDLVKKMPGITVQNGQVQAHGETVQKVTLDGRELFGDDATAALRNLPAEIVDKIQIFDRLSDQAQFTGFDDGSSTKGINIVTKANMRNGQFGRVFAGYGTDNRYSAGGNTTFLNGNRKVSIVGNFNNVNQQNFAQQDLLGVTSSAQRGGGGQRGGNRGSGGGGSSPAGGGGQFGSSSNFLVGQQNGINSTNSFGINYADNWGSKVKVSGSYFFNNTNNITDESVNRQYFLEGIPNFEQYTGSNSVNNNHRFNMRFEYKFDSANSLIITPSLSFQDNKSTRDVATAFFDNQSNLIASTRNLNNNQTSGNNLRNNILYRHSFPKRGRTLSVNLNTSYNRREGEVYASVFDTTFTSPMVYDDSLSQRLTDQLTNGYQLASNIVYTEPLGKNSQLQINYSPTYSKSRADQQAYEYDVADSKYSIFSPQLSNNSDVTSNAHNAGIGYRYGTRDNQFNIGANYQQTSLHSDQDYPRALTVDKSFTNILPNAMLRLKLTDRSNIRLMYRASTNQPSVTQLQDVYDITNQPFITSGNPNLNQQYSHTLSTRYTLTKTNGLLVVGNVFLQTASDYITNATFIAINQDSILSPGVVLQKGQQLTKPVNLDGFSSVRSFVTFAMPLKFIKSTFNVNGGITYSRLPGIINNVPSTSNNLTYNFGSVIASNVSQYVDFTVSYSANLSKVKTELQPTLNNNYFSHTAGLRMILLSKRGWFFENDLNHQLYSGLSEGFNQDYFLWNMRAGKKFLPSQRAELSVSVFDLLKQNRSISRNVTETYIEDVQNTVLQQYFMVTFAYNLRNFGAAAAKMASPTKSGGRLF